MGWNDQPKAPDPGEVAAGQTATNVGTAVANNTLNKVNQFTPYGNLTYTQGPITKWTDPQSEKTYDLPSWTATQTLSPTGQKLFDSQSAAQQNLADIGRDQSAKIGDLLNKPLDLSKAPAVTTPQLQGQLASGGKIYRGLGVDQPDLQTKIGPTGQVAMGRDIDTPALRDSFRDAPRLQLNVQNAGDITNDIDRAGRIRQGISSAGRVTGQIEDAGDITRSYGTDFSQDRRRVEQALMSRMNPQLEQERSRLESQLANQGIKLGTAAYDRAMANYGQRANDAQMGAILSGGQEQSRLADLEARRAGFENAAQAQAYSQNANNAGFANQAQAQRFGQNATEAQFYNAGQAQRFGQNATRSQFANAAQAQQYGQNANDMTQRNAASGQRFAQDQAQAAFGNSARQQDFGNQLAQQQAMNAAQQQNFAQAQARAGFANTANQQQFQNQYTQLGFANQAQAQAAQQAAQQGAFANQAAQQNFGNQQSQRNNYLQEQYAARAQPINEIASLLGTGQVQQPNFVNTPAAQMPGVDYAGIVQQGYANQMAGKQNNPWGGIMGGAFSLGTSLLL